MSQQKSLEGKVVIVTGAGRGIGRDIALLMGKEGAKVIVNDLGGGPDGEGSPDLSVASEVVKEIEAAGGKASPNGDSVAEAASAEKIIKQAVDTFGRIDCVVNNAGILRDRIFHRMSTVDWQMVINVHLNGCFYMSRAAAPYFKEQQSGSFVHFTSASPNPVARSSRSTGVTHSITRGISQSGNFLRGWLHLGFNQGEDGAPVHDGMWPIIAGRRIALNFRWAQPDGVLELYQAGSEGPQWWLPAADPVRGLPAAGILDRCTRTQTCPKVIEHFGSAEVWALKLTPEWVGTDGKADLPLPESVRRYYIGSSTHGGGAGGFDRSLPGVGLPKTGPACPGNNYGTGALPANPVPHTHTVNALREHFRHWVMNGVAPPPNRYPTLAQGTLAEAHKAAIGFPTLPMLRPGIPEPDFILPVLDYDFGPQFNAQDGAGIASNAPPGIKRTLTMYAPRVDADGNERGGVPVVLLDAPLGTYLGWNLTAGGARPFHQDQVCNYVGGMIPFAKTADERKASGDPRLSLQERYGSHDGYVAAVSKAAARAVQEGFLLPVDAATLIEQAKASAVLR